MSQTSSDVESRVEALTLHSRGLVLLLGNFLSLKCLTTARDKRNFGISNASTERGERFVSPDHGGWNRSHTFKIGGFRFCDEVRLCLQVLSCC